MSMKKKETKTCPECWFENGKHSFECPKYVEREYPITKKADLFFRELKKEKV